MRVLTELATTSAVGLTVELCLAAVASHAIAVSKTRGATRHAQALFAASHAVVVDARERAATALCRRVLDARFAAIGRVSIAILVTVRAARRAAATAAVRGAVRVLTNGGTAAARAARADRTRIDHSARTRAATRGLSALERKQPNANPSARAEHAEPQAELRAVRKPGRAGRSGHSLCSRIRRAQQTVLADKIHGCVD
jgi:hypothetical protein